MMTDRVRSGNRNKTSATQLIFETLQNEILSGKIVSGELLSENALAERFKVSRTPVRKALGMLASEGLVITLPKRGHQVRTVSLSEIRDAFYLRELLEMEAVSLAMKRMRPEDYADLRQEHKRIWSKFVDMDASGTSDFAEKPSTNRSYHLLLARASGNPILADFIGQLLKRMEQLMALDPNLAGPMPAERDAFQEELEVIDAMEAGDEPAARTAVRRHIRNTLSEILRMA